MADHEALVEVSIGRSSFKISGTEAFIEKMIEVLPTLFPAPSDVDEDDDDDSNAAGAGGKPGHEDDSLDDFVTRYKITNTLPEVKRVSAFIFYLTIVKKAPTCTRAQIDTCFDESGLTTPNNLLTVINNATKPRYGYIRSVSTGNYANYVKPASITTTPFATAVSIGLLDRRLARGSASSGNCYSD